MNRFFDGNELVKILNDAGLGVEPLKTPRLADGSTRLGGRKHLLVA